MNLRKILKTVFYILGGSVFFKYLPDRVIIIIQYTFKIGRKPDLLSPKTFNEKIQWLKLYGNLQNYTRLTDKYEVREYIAETIGRKYLIPLIGVWDNFEDIEFDKLPQQFVLKCNHDSNSAIICTDKASLNIKKARKKLNRCLDRNFYYLYREPQYKDIKPRIVCEKYMIDESGVELKDYKIFCFDGVPKIIQVDYDRFISHKRNLYDTEWNYIPASINYPSTSDRIISKPDKLEEMLSLAKALSADYPHVRVDFYLIVDKIYFGELTFTHGAGYEKFEPEEFGVQMGSWMSTVPLSKEK